MVEKRDARCRQEKGEGRAREGPSGGTTWSAPCKARSCLSCASRRERRAKAERAQRGSWRTAARRRGEVRASTARVALLRASCSIQVTELSLQSTACPRLTRASASPSPDSLLIARHGPLEGSCSRTRHSVLAGRELTAPSAARSTGPNRQRPRNSAPCPPPAPPRPHLPATSTSAHPAMVGAPNGARRESMLPSAGQHASTMAVKVGQSSLASPLPASLSRLDLAPPEPDHTER